MVATLTSTLGIVPLKDNTFTIGRSPNNGLFINHATISRHHAEVRPYHQGYGILDLGSTSGTFVNGERLVPQTPRLLHSGDAIQVGSFPILYEEKSAIPSLETLPSPDPSTSGTVARAQSSTDNQPQSDLLAAPDFLSLSPVSDGLLPAPGGPISQLPDTPYDVLSQVAPGLRAPDLQREPAPLEKPARRVIAPVTPVPPFYAPSPEPPINLAQKQLQFTSFYPRAAKAESWQTLLVYAHVAETLETVREDARRLRALLDAGVPAADVQAAHPLTMGTQITVVPVFQGVSFQPERVSFTWTNDWQPAALRFSADPRWAGRTVWGEVLLLAGPLMIASLRISLHFTEPGIPPNPDQEQEEVSVARYKNIFTSYSQDDVAMVQAIRQAYKAIGDDSFLDIEALRSSQSWNSVLPRAIESADVFQLCWSQHAAQSQLVYEECQYALQHYKYDGFIRPIYWEKPLAFSPPQLAHLSFTYYEFVPTPEI